MAVCVVKDCDKKAVKCDLCLMHFEIRLQNKQSERTRKIAPFLM